MVNSARTKNNTCCRDKKKMVRCAVDALEKMKMMFEAVYGKLPEQQNKGPNSCAMDDNCTIKGCPFKNASISPNVLMNTCTKDDAMRSRASTKGRADRNAMRLQQGEVGLRGDRATFHMGQAGPQQQPAAAVGSGRSGGAVFYRMQAAPPKVPVVVTKRGKQQQQAAAAAPLPPSGKHVMQLLPPLPGSTEPMVGPVTGLPVGPDEHIFVLRLGKRPGEPDEKARVQIEVRVPKQCMPKHQEADTQYVEADVPAAPVADKAGKKGAKSKK